MNIYNESIDYNKKYIKYKIKYLEAKNKINNDIVVGGYYNNKIYNDINGGYDFDNIIIIFINNINNYIEHERNLKINELNSEVINLHQNDNYSYKILLGIIQFLLCVICSLMTVNTSIIDVTMRLSDSIATYFEEKDINKFINELYTIIPCSKQFGQIFIDLFNSLSAHLKDKIVDFVTKLKANNKKFFNTIKNTGKQIIYTGAQIKNRCSILARNLLQSRFGLKSIQLQGGGLIAQAINNIGCYATDTEAIYKIYKTIKDFTIDQLKDVVIADIDNNIIKILYISKYIIKFIFRMIFVVVPNLIIQEILDFIDTILSLIITISILSLDSINNYIILFFEQILPRNNLSILIIKLLKATYEGQSCNF
jgi:hypothetical protein